jgi:hypothetical protein
MVLDPHRVYTVRIGASGILPVLRIRTPDPLGSVHRFGKPDPDLFQRQNLDPTPHQILCQFIKKVDMNWPRHKNAEKAQRGEKHVKMTAI